MQAEVPYKAGRVVEKGLADGVVEENEGNYRLLSQAWQMSGEFDKAIPALKKAAATSDDGKLDLRLSSSYLNLGRYEECVDAARTALRRKVERPAAAQEILAMCLFELEKYEDAKKAFRLAAKDEKIQKRARNWIKFIENEQSRIAQLDDSIRQARAARNAARNRLASPN
jgi:tetratricopeptide (TPR) repeat protein